MEAKAMLPTPAAQENLALLLKGKLSGEARKCIFGSTYATIKKLIKNLKRVYAPSKRVYQLQGELVVMHVETRNARYCSAVLRYRQIFQTEKFKPSIVFVHLVSSQRSSSS